MVRVADVASALDRIWPFRSADDWDNVGLLVGDSTAAVETVWLTVDVTADVITEAIANRAQLLISHHPLILAGQKSISSETAIGSQIFRSIQANLSIIALHTNADHPESGVSEALAHCIGIANLVALDSVTGHGRVGNVTPQSLRHFAEHVSRVLPSCQAPIRVAGDPDREVQRVAVLAGSGASYLGLATQQEVDVFITSDLKHHQALDFLATIGANQSPGLIDVSHWAAERTWLEVAAARIRAALPELKVGISHLVTDPWSFTLQS